MRTSKMERVGGASAYGGAQECKVHKVTSTKNCDGCL